MSTSSWWDWVCWVGTIFFVVAGLWCGFVAAEDTPSERIDLVNSVVLVDSNEPSYVQYAARDLARYLSDLTKQTVPVSASARDIRRGRVSIVLGRTMTSAVGATVSLTEAFGPQGAVIKSFERSGEAVVVVTGSDPHGTNLGVASLIQMIRSERSEVYLEGPLDVRTEPSIRVRGFHMNGGWQLNHPYGFRTWTEEDWKRFVDIVWAERGNLIFMWPYVETMTVPLTGQDEAYLQEFRRVVEYAQKQRGMEVWIMQSANRIAVTDCGVPDPRLRPHWIEGCQKDMEPADPEQLARISKSFEALYRIVNNADAFCLIDSDPGGWPESPLSDQLRIFLEARKLLDRCNTHGQQTKLVDWMWIGWGRHTSKKAPQKLGTVFNFTGKFPSEDDIDFMAKTIRNFKNNLPGPWELIAGMTPYLESARREGAMDRTIYLPYGVIESEPAFPATNMGFDSLREVLAKHEAYPELRGWMGNNELLLLQFPRSFFYMNSLWDSKYRSTSEREVLEDISRYLYPDYKQVIADAYLALQKKDVDSIRAAIQGLAPMTGGSESLRRGAIGRFLFPDGQIVIKSLQMQLQIQLARQQLLNALTGSVTRTESERLVEDYFDKILAWNKETGWEKTIDINIWRSPLYERDKEFSDGLVRLKQVLADGRPYADYEQIQTFFAPIAQRLLRKYPKNSVMIGCIEPFKLAVLQSQ